MPNSESDQPSSQSDDLPNRKSDQDVKQANSDANERGTGFLAVMQSVGAAMIGVQSSKNKERDFTQGKPLHFIIGGLLGTFIFLVCIWLLVQYLIASS